MTSVNSGPSQEKHSGEFVATSRDTGRVVAHALSIRKLYAELKRKGVNPIKTIVEKIPPKSAVVIY